MAYIKGIDISHHQGKVDWSKVKQDFVILKASEGLSFKDAMFESYRTSARAKKIPLGFYHFARGIDPVKEADWFLRCVNEIKIGEVLALDFEIHIADPIGFCNKFVERIHEKVGFWLLFYSYSSMAALFKSGSVLNCGLWIADPSARPRTGAWKTWAIWQYTVAKAGKTPGFTTTVDQDYFNGTVEQFKKYGKWPTVDSTVPAPVVAVSGDPVVIVPSDTNNTYTITVPVDTTPSIIQAITTFFANLFKK